MNKIVRLESNGLLHCAFHPLCSVTRCVDIKGVNYPRKAAQQYMLKHEKKCTYNPRLHTTGKAKTLQDPSQATSTQSSPAHHPLLQSTQVTYNNFLPTTQNISPVLVDCAVLCAWNSNVSPAKLEQKLKNATLLSLALSASGLTVWPSSQLALAAPVPSAATTIHNTKHVVLLFQAGEFRDTGVDEQFMDELRVLKQLQKRTTVLLFDAPNILSVVSPPLLDNELMNWLQSPAVHTYVVQMKFFYVIINAIVNTIE